MTIPMKKPSSGEKSPRQRSAALAAALQRHSDAQKLADGGYGDGEGERHRADAAKILGEMPAFMHGGLVRGPGGPTSDTVPAMLSPGEIVLPSDTVRKVGARELLATIAATHEPTGKPPFKAGRVARADGGFADDPMRRNAFGDAAAGPGFQQVPAAPAALPVAAPPPVAALSPPLAPPSVQPFNPASGIGRPNALGSLADAKAQLSSLQASNTAAPGAGLSMIGSLQAPQTAADRFAAPPVGSPPATPGAAASAPTSGAGSPLNFLRTPRPAAVAAPVAKPIAPIPAPPAPRYTTRTGGADALAMADGGLVEDPNKKLADAAAAQLAAYVPQTTMAVMPDASGASVPVMASPAAALPAQTMAPAAAPARSGIIRTAEAGTLPSASAKQGSRDTGVLPQTAEYPRAPLVQDLAPSVAANAPAPIPVAPEPRALLGTLPPGVARSGNSYSGGASLPAAEAPVSMREHPLGSRADTFGQLASMQASNAAGPQGGAVLLDGAAAEADRRARFNEEANLRNAVNQGSWSPRKGFQGNDAAVAAAMAPIEARAKLAQTSAVQAGELQRAQVQERGTDARARLSDARAATNTAIDQQRLGLEVQKTALDARREDRAVQAAAPTLAQAQRKANLQAIVADPARSAEERSAAVQQIAGMEGREVTGKGTGAVSTEIRKEFEGLPEVKSYKQALPSYKGIEDAVQRNTPMSDINIVYGIAKLYDPNSVVREGEYATVAKAPGMPERVKGWAQYIAGGGKLTAEVKSQILDEAKSRMTSFENEYGAARARYQDIAGRSGADASLVVPQNHQPAVRPPPGALPAAQTAEAHAALPSGATYTAPDGSVRRKK